MLPYCVASLSAAGGERLAELLDLRRHHILAVRLKGVVAEVVLVVVLGGMELGGGGHFCHNRVRPGGLRGLQRGVNDGAWAGSMK